MRAFVILSAGTCCAIGARAQATSATADDLPIATVRYLTPAPTGALRFDLGGKVVTPCEHLWSGDGQGLAHHVRRTLSTSLLAVLCAGDLRMPLTIPAAEHLRRKGRDVSVVGLTTWLADPPLPIWADQIDVALGLRVVKTHAAFDLVPTLGIGDDAPRMVRAERDDLGRALGRERGISRPRGDRLSVPRPDRLGPLVQHVQIARVGVHAVALLAGDFAHDAEFAEQVDAAGHGWNREADAGGHLLDAL